MKFDILTLFPEMFSNVIDKSILGNAKTKGLVEINCINIRDFSKNKHKKVDDYTYGGGEGMVMSPQPVYDAFKSIDGDALVIYLTPKGRRFDQKYAEFLSKQNHVALLCGHYEGIDERVLNKIVDIELSLGDFVLTGGEIPAMAVVDATCRMIPGVISPEPENINESLYNSVLEYPQYTRPAEFHGESVPSVLLSGNHQKVNEWRTEKSIEQTLNKRPDLLESRRIGILGGTFDPIHIGHLHIAEKALSLYNLDRILFIPSNSPPHKDNNNITSSLHRMNMVAIAIAENPQFELSTIELQRDGITYTIDTVKELLSAYPNDKFFYIIGEKEEEIMTWKNGEDLLKMIEFIFLPRELNISSTDVRENMNRYLLPNKVFDYIKKHGLYMN
ncbi:MAG: tRNA (guanosine(37)-N1)-methyltransferase TrmD [Clostridiales bacterium]|jgi:tRNA (guanine37-N1)-methyltransferase|nr:tRNA (guanosine(37)-N1)-methyltransferase TrmD [Clostridiales bacterium]